MTLFELRLHVKPSVLSFCDFRAAPIDFPNSFPWLQDVDDLTLIARASSLRGPFSNQNASTKATVRNENKQAANLLRRPLRCRAELFKNTVPYFTGLVQLSEFGPAILTLTIEA